MKQLLDAEHGGCRDHLLLPLVLRYFLGFERENDILENRHMRVEGVVLKNHGDLSNARWQFVHYLIVDENLSRARPFEAGDHPQKRRLPATRGTQQHEELPLTSTEIDAIHRPNLAKILFETSCPHLRHLFSLPHYSFSCDTRASQA